jgi:hypothetical protein
MRGRAGVLRVTDERMKSIRYGERAAAGGHGPFGDGESVVSR